MGNSRNRSREFPLEPTLGRLVLDYTTYVILNKLLYIITYGHFHVVDQSESVLPRKAGIARGRRLVDFELFAQIVNGRRKQLYGVVDESRLQLCTNTIGLLQVPVRN